MAKPRRKASNSTPVTQHQLFPAVVALWFGALFGLGSLAVRPSLLEEFVVKSKIDLLVPVAAPPLGMTARMLVALALAVLGAMLGTLIARRLARPNPEIRERKRTNLSTRDEGGANPYSGHAEASTNNPAAADPGEGASPAWTPTGRRRSLAIEPEAGEFVPHEIAPLPGGGAPQIFDIAAAGLSGLPQSVLPSAVPAELSELAPGPAPAQVALDWANAEALQSAEPLARTEPVAAPDPAPRVENAEPDDGRQVFGMAPPANPPLDQPRQIFGMPVVEDHVPREFVEAQGFRTSVFVAPEPAPLFPARAAVVAVNPELAETVEPAAHLQAFEPPAEPPVAAEIAPEAALPSPSSLGTGDLSARLAESMRRRRASRAAAGSPAASTAVCQTPAGIAPSLPLAAEALPTVPAAPNPEPEAAAAVPAFSVPPFEVPAFAVPAAIEPDELPAALRALDLTGFEAEDRFAEASLLPPRRITEAAEAVPAQDEPEAAEEPGVAEENYGSLLGVTPSPATLRNPFVRVDEPQDPVATAEPVVIFPGQAVPAPQPFAPPAANSAETPQFRRFDAPASAEQGQPVAASEGANPVPPEEAERALRSALANLQRMSGAA